jgi:murein DD-endopeptidase MepM/ murein hydrolase activator NlpD
VFDVDLLDRNDNLLTSGISSSTSTTTSTPKNNPIVEKRKCTTFIITIPPQTFIELCSLAPIQSTQQQQQHGSSWSNVEIESDIQPITVHPYPNDIHLYTMHFPFQPIDNSNNDDNNNNNNPNSSCCGAFQCIQSEKGELTHFFKGNYHAIDFACPIGTPLYSPVNGTVVSICQHQGSNDNSSNNNNNDDGNGGSTIIEVSGIAATNMFHWNSIMIQVANDDINNDDDPLYVEFVHIQTNSCVVQVGHVVHKGQYICSSGSVGFSPVPHLHMAAYRSSDDDAPTVRFRFECFSLPLDVSSKEEQDKDDSIICKMEKAAIEEEDKVTRSFLPLAGGWYDCNGLCS